MTDRHARAVEGAIADGQHRGAFDDLPGAGKPLDLGDISDPDWWVKQVIKREKLDMSGAMPPALVLRREAASYPEALVEEHRETVVREVIEDYNRRVLDDRRRPVVGPPPPVAPILDGDEVVTAWRRLRSEYEQVLRERAAAAARSQDTAASNAPRRRRWWRRPR